MNGSYRWLCDLMPGTSLSVDEIVDRLALRGAPVEGWVSLGAGLDDIVVARVESVVKHPNADRLSLCQVEAGEGPVQVVCGAPVIHEGGYYPFAGPGVTIPAGFTLERREIRGEFSNGMLCSEKELDLGRDQAGIMQLEGEFTPGQSLIEVLNLSVNQTLSRTLLTSGTTMAAVLSLFFLGGEVVRPFALAMAIGIVVGTYSSVFIAAPTLLFLEQRFGSDDESGSKPAKPARKKSGSKRKKTKAA